MENKYETIIVGAGPAGLIAGQHLDDALILERKSEIGKPVQCGEGISISALEFQNILPDKNWISSEIHKIKRIMPNGKAIGRWHEKPVGYIIDRTKFEKALAEKNKADIKLNIEVIDIVKEKDLWKIIVKNGEVFYSKYIIGADGPNSIVRRKIFPENNKKIDFFPALGYLIKTQKEINNKNICFYFNNKKYNYGYGWIFPKSSNTANVGVEGKGITKKIFDDFLKEAVKKECGDYKIIESKNGSIPTRKKFFKFYKSNALLIGDAAGLADPMFKGGMNQAMLSAKIATNLINKNKVNLYDKEINSMPFTKNKLNKARNIFYTLNNQTLDKLGEIWENKLNYSKIKLVLILFRNKKLFSAYKAFKIWKENRDYLW